MDEIDAILKKTDEDVISEASEAGMDIDAEVEKTKAIFEKAVAKWGVEFQVNMAIEECAELILALRHYDRCKVSSNYVCSEVADVEIMMAQMRVILGATRVEREKKKKLALLTERINDRLQAAKEG